jgi:hypothetical protein
VGLSITVTRNSHNWYQPQAGSLTLETAKELTSARMLLPLGKGQGPGIRHPTRSQTGAATISVELKE